MSAAGLHDLGELNLDPYDLLGARLVVVADTDALLSSIDNQCRTGWTPRLLQLAESSTAQLYAADHVYGETYEGFAKVVGPRSAAPAELQACFEEHYLPVIRWVKTEVDSVVDERVSEVTDVTDVPTAHLASLVAPCLVLSEDHSLRDPGFAPEEWRAAAGHGVDVVDGQGMQQAVTMSVGIPAYGVVWAGIRLGERARIPWWGSVALMAGGSYWLLKSPQRREAIGRWAVPAFQLVMESLAAAERKEQEGMRHLKELLFTPNTPPPPLMQQVATVLSRSSTPLLAKEVQEKIEDCWGEDGTPSVAAVRSVLTDGSEFTQPERYRWQLGRLGGPWRPARD